MERRVGGVHGPKTVKVGLKVGHSSSTPATSYQLGRVPYSAKGTASTPPPLQGQDRSSAFHAVGKGSLRALITHPIKTISSSALPSPCPWPPHFVLFCICEWELTPRSPNARSAAPLRTACTAANVKGAGWGEVGGLSSGTKFRGMNPPGTG